MNELPKPPPIYCCWKSHPVPRDSLREYVENEPTEWVVSESNDGGFGGLFQLAVNMVFFFLFILIRIVAALIGV